MKQRIHCDVNRWVGMMGIAALLGVTFAAGADDWPQWRGIDRDGISTETGWKSDWGSEKPPVAWQADLGPSTSCVSVVGDRAYVMGNVNNRDILYCFDAGTGREIWRNDYACPLSPRSFEGGPGCTPVVDDGRIYTLSHQGDLRCVDAAKGELIWSKSLTKDFGGKRPRWGYAESPLVVGDLLLVKPGGNGAGLVALDRKTGSTKWRQGSEGASYASSIGFTFRNTDCVAVFNDFGLETRRASDGRVFGRYPWKTSYDVHAATPIVHDDQIFISSGYGSGGAVVQVTSDKLVERYTTKEMGNQMTPSVLVDGYLYGFSGNAGRRSSLVCMEFSTGTVKYRKSGTGYGGIIAADGKLIIMTEQSELIIAPADPGGLKPTTQFKPFSGRCWVNPTLANGLLYLRNNDGKLVVYNVKE